MKRKFSQTAAALVAVVFLLFASGCRAWNDPEPESSGQPAVSEQKNAEAAPASKPPRRKRKRASDYSRIPVNAPADWQRATIGM